LQPQGICVLHHQIRGSPITDWVIESVVSGIDIRTSKFFFMKMGKLKIPVFLIASAFLFSCKKENESGIEVITATGNISARVDEFRQLLGAQLNTTPGATGGHREINWDGVPGPMLATPLPNNFFNAVEVGAPASRQKGLIYSADGSQFEVSKTNFSEINSPASSQFKAFSREQTFSNISSNLWDVGFEAPAKRSASVKGFGIVFSDVDL
jgi:hypothetical protein